MKRPEALAAKCLPGVFKKIVKFIGAKLWYNKGRERGAAHGAAFPCLKCRGWAFACAGRDTTEKAW